MTDNEKRAHDYTIAIINGNIASMGSGLGQKHIENIKKKPDEFIEYEYVRLYEKVLDVFNKYFSEK